jgi:hypothetical protein
MFDGLMVYGEINEFTLLDMENTSMNTVCFPTLNLPSSLTNIVSAKAWARF